MEKTDARLASFKSRAKNSWPFKLKKYPCNPQMCAEAGLYIDQLPSTLKCYLCNTSISSWESSDDPLQKHAEANPECPLVAIRLRSLDSAPTSQRWHLARAQTFGAWWPHNNPSAQNVAEAGFWSRPSTDALDNAECMYCKVSLDGWEEGDDPVYEHKRRRPDCEMFKVEELPTVVTAKVVEEMTSQAPEEPVVEELKPAKSRKKIHGKEAKDLTEKKAMTATKRRDLSKQTQKEAESIIDDSVKETLTPKPKLRARKRSSEEADIGKLNDDDTCQENLHDSGDEPRSKRSTTSSISSLNTMDEGNNFLLRCEDPLSGPVDLEDAIPTQLESETRVMVEEAEPERPRKRAAGTKAKTGKSKTAASAGIKRRRNGKAKAKEDVGENSIVVAEELQITSTAAMDLEPHGKESMNMDTTDSIIISSGKASINIESSKETLTKSDSALCLAIPDASTLAPILKSFPSTIDKYLFTENEANMTVGDFLQHIKVQEMIRVEKECGRMLDQVKTAVQTARTIIIRAPIAVEERSGETGKNDEDDEEEEMDSRTVSPMMTAA